LRRRHTRAIPAEGPRRGKGEEGRFGQKACLNYWNLRDVLRKRLKKKTRIVDFIISIPIGSEFGSLGIIVMTV